ncbi:MAG TPA: hypothetical protein VKP12_03785 [Kiloniellaceae bacterium]|nr:hypothetical protein [Kiloniellaceae bacterium]
MLSSLQDITGLFPGLFQRGQPAGAADEAARGQGRAHHGNVGRDPLSLSPAAQAIDGAAQGDDAQGADNEGGALGQAGGMIRKALEAIRHDLGKALAAFGFDGAAVENFTKAFVEPVLSALKEGVNFTAELTFAAFSQVTTMKSNGDFSQQTSLVAQSLEIAVNHDTGEVSVSLAKLSFEEQVRSTGGAGATPLLVIDPEDLASPQELAAKILASGETAAARHAEPAPAEPAEDAGEPVAEGEETPVAEGEETSATAQALEEKLAALRERLAEDARSLQTRLTIYSISVSRNDKGETITKLLLDAELSVARLADTAPAEEAQSLDLTA